MKNDINIFGSKFETELFDYLKEKTEFNIIQKKYKKAKENLQKNNKKRIEIISNIRTNKVEEINEELKNTKKELEGLRSEIENIFYKYCEIHGHKFEIINKELLRETGRHSFREGFQHEMILTNKCRVCGIMQREFHTGYGFAFNNKDFKREIPYEIYDDKSLSSSRKSIRDIEKEIEVLENYIEYLLSLKNRLCELFGHDAKEKGKDIWGNPIFKCDCCGKRINEKEYSDSYSSANYRGMTSYPYDYDEDKVLQIVREPKKIEELESDLPTFEEYQKKIVLKKENMDKN